MNFFLGRRGLGFKKYHVLSVINQNTHLDFCSIFFFMDIHVTLLK
jgi:hypothetical protein